MYRPSRLLGLGSRDPGLWDEPFQAEEFSKFEDDTATSLELLLVDHEPWTWESWFRVDVDQSKLTTHHSRPFEKLQQAMICQFSTTSTFETKILGFNSKSTSNYSLNNPTLGAGAADLRHSSSTTGDDTVSAPSFFSLASSRRQKYSERSMRQQPQKQMSKGKKRPEKARSTEGLVSCETDSPGGGRRCLARALEQGGSI
ncbi:hypothetical protein BJ508DRAFT_372867 [Ascobolus immersus RN42]|uniref:Uncharacterized protein n=1 Tax=Ascobolus immersus RN42 TaxID=1160509 RepID=A0A3N4IPH2_ASCIM|nr:hypothetical protein BJ508DRAFT_372867 [Ascobolus immersus RN42]